jgi:hypothetical protein
VTKSRINNQYQAADAASRPTIHPNPATVRGFLEFTMKTTLNRIREHSPCKEGWSKLLTYLGKTSADDEPLEIATIVESNGLDDALWCLRAVEGEDRKIRLFAVWCARRVQHLMTDTRSLRALDVAEAYANGTATLDELKKARGAAGDAAWAATRAATRDAAWAATRAATRDAAWAATMAATRDAAWAAAWDAGKEAEIQAQTQELLRICKETT